MPARSSVMTCFEIALSETRNGLAISLMVAGRSLSRRRIARRVGSASAEKTRSSSVDRKCSTMRLNIMQARFDLSIGLLSKDCHGEALGSSAVLDAFDTAKELIGISGLMMLSSSEASGSSAIL
jgi:hypothetical protein